MEVLSASTAQDAAKIVIDSVAAGRKLDVRGRGTKADIGAPSREGAVLDVSGIAGIVDYDPAELVLTVRPGTPLAEVEALLAEHRQMLAFEPLDPGGLTGSGAGATIGGTVAAGFAGSRRLTRGGARDHLLGFTAVSGRGETFVAGGKVVKNVTGYDLPKIFAGSWGRLGVITEMTLKVLPAPREQVTHAVMGLSPQAAYSAMAGAMGSTAEVAAAAYRPTGPDGKASVTAFRLEGIAPSIAARIPVLAAALDGMALRPLEDDAGIWAGVNGLHAARERSQIWRIVLPARTMPTLAATLEANGETWLADWAGGLIWTTWSMQPGQLRELVKPLEGHAMLMRAHATERSTVPAFHPLPPLLAQLEYRVRRAFDPAGVFENGRFGVPQSAD